MTADAVLHARTAIAVPKDWSDVARVCMHVQQEYQYTYSAPVTDIRQRLIMVPPGKFGDQQLRSHELTVEGADDAVMEWENDRFGNRVCKVRASRVRESVRFAVEFEVERFAPPQSQRLHPNAVIDPYLAPTALTAPDDRIREAGASLLASLPHAPVPEEIVPLDSHGLRQWMLAILAGEWTSKAIKYQHGQTGVQTPAAMALHLGGGVCQDYAHIAIAVLRTLSVPARYVSGHVLGEGAPHAWFEAILPDPSEPSRLIAMAYDPTHHRRPGMSYATVAVGRDYADVAPTSGSYTGIAGSRLIPTKDAWLVELQQAQE
ncbi:MAG TPA: transglutaminase family protein [Gemmatimonadaceae bacterium]|nr:transglutaminase family protein [Gemmatimonadaceae bacterium]